MFIIILFNDLYSSKKSTQLENICKKYYSISKLINYFSFSKKSE